jgi:hypothetical protein
MYLNQIDQLIDILLNIYYFKLKEHKILLFLKTNNKPAVKRINKKELDFINKFDNINKFIEQFINDTFNLIFSHLSFIGGVFSFIEESHKFSINFILRSIILYR